MAVLKTPGRDESLLGSKVKKEKEGAGSPVTSGRDELELYLADPEEPHIEVDVLAWPLVAMEPRADRLGSPPPLNTIQIVPKKGLPVQDRCQRPSLCPPPGFVQAGLLHGCLLYTSPSPRD